MNAVLLIGLALTGAEADVADDPAALSPLGLTLDVALMGGGNAIGGDLAANLWLDERHVLRFVGRGVITSELFSESTGDLAASILMLGYRYRFLINESEWTDSGAFLEGSLGVADVNRSVGPCSRGFLGTSCDSRESNEPAASARVGVSLSAWSFLLLEPFADFTLVGETPLVSFGLAFGVGVAGR